MGTRPKPNPIPNPNHTPNPNPKRTKKTNPSPNPNNPKPKPKLHDPQKCLGLLINLVQIKSLCAKSLNHNTVSRWMFRRVTRNITLCSDCVTFLEYKDS